MNPLPKPPRVGIAPNVEWEQWYNQLWFLIQQLQQGSAPTGSSMDYDGATAPSGWLFRDGSAVSRTTYADLFAALGTAYGVGDGSTTFNLPSGSMRHTPWTLDSSGAAAIIGFDTATAVSLWSRRVGDSMDLLCKFTAGAAPSAVQAKVTLPGGKTIDATKVPAIRSFGMGHRNESTDVNTSRTVLGVGGNAYVNFSPINAAGSNNPLSPANGNAISAGGEVFVFSANGIPITGWSSDSIIKT